MLTDINREIYELKEQLRAKEKLDIHKEKMEIDLKSKKNQLTSLQAQLVEEGKDVEKLESTSISSIFYSLVGKKEEKLDKEKEEYLAVKLKFDDCRESIKKLESELEEVKRKLRVYGGIEDELKRKIDEKKEILLRDGGVNGKELREKLDRINNIKLDLNELREAIMAGKRAKDSLIDMENALDKARDWGALDMLGGGFLVSMAKHSSIDEANRMSKEFQYRLRAFQKELEDVDEFTDIDVNISEFVSFADFFFDGLFVDWFVQSKINESLDKVRESLSKINSVVNNLEMELKNLETQMQETEKDINRILEF